MYDARSRRNGACKLLVSLVDRRNDVRSICSTVTFSSKVEGDFSILRVAREEELQESIDVLSCDRTCVDLGAIGAIRVADVDRLVQEAMGI